MSKFAGKFRKNDEYGDDFSFIKSSRKKRKNKEHGEIKKKLRQWEYENRHDEEDNYRRYKYWNKKVVDNLSSFCYNVVYSVGDYIMIIYGNIRKSKPKKLTKVQQSEYDAWCKKVGIGVKTKKITKSTFSTNSQMPKLVIPAERDPRRFQSLDTGVRVANWNKKDKVTQYTGTKMIGVGTLHKSNAVPVFNDDEAKDMAKMRR